MRTICNKFPCTFALYIILRSQVGFSVITFNHASSEGGMLSLHASICTANRSRECSSHTELCSLHKSFAYWRNQGAAVIILCKFQHRMKQDSFHLPSNHTLQKHTAHFVTTLVCARRVQKSRANPRVQKSRANPRVQKSRANPRVQKSRANPRVQKS